MIRLFAIIPVKDLEQGKSRLSPVLEPSMRYRLNLALLRRTLKICVSQFGSGATLLVSSSERVHFLARSAGVGSVAEDAGDPGLNGALRAASETAIAAGAQGVVVIPTDLPLLSPFVLRAAIAAMPDRPGCVVVPDYRESGTNLMALAPASSRLFAFGESSLVRHAEGPRRAGYVVRIHRCPALSMDLDLPEDYERLRRVGSRSP